MIPPASRWWWVRPHVYRAGWLDQTTRVEPDQPAPAGPGKNRSRKKVLNLEQIVWKWEKGWIWNKVLGNEKMGAECQMCFYQCFVWRLFSDGFCYDGNLDLNQGRIWNINRTKKYVGSFAACFMKKTQGSAKILLLLSVFFTDYHNQEIYKAMLYLGSLSSVKT